MDLSSQGFGTLCKQPRWFPIQDTMKMQENWQSAQHVTEKVIGKTQHGIRPFQGRKVGWALMRPTQDIRTESGLNCWLVINGMNHCLPEKNCLSSGQQVAGWAQLEADQLPQLDEDKAEDNTLLTLSLIFFRLFPGVTGYFNLRPGGAGAED